MKILYISHSTEYEKGWGSKPDGILISKDKTILEDRIKPYNNREKVHMNIIGIIQKLKKFIVLIKILIN